MSMSVDLDSAKASMEKALGNLSHDFNGLRTGRPNPAQLEDIMVDYYGVATPITQVAAIKVPDAHMMTVEPWDKGLVSAVEHAISASNLGITPNDDGAGVIRLPFPSPTEERRKEIVKDCRAAAEKARVGVRAARSDAKKKIEREQKEGEITEDEMHRAEDELQKLTDSYVAKVDKALTDKEAEVMEI